VAGPCEHSNEPYRTIVVGKLLEKLSESKLLKDSTLWPVGWLI